ncbi:hypothetical protein QTJ16_000330 [Diplocarpon rosae]|uniref:2EXR domain-containing protein n=1 Tax=Diplocarpon rosae TaxID=946125 RepID=A0AAD9T720_9HELO|nr:hypothetical protein QTJ16_000330 [Diplocarpon rosae]
MTSQDSFPTPTTIQDSIIQVTSKPKIRPSPCVNFSSLPAEIRLVVWKLAIPEPRILRMCIPRDKARVPWTYSTSSPSIPIILHINQESRTVGLSLFTLNFPFKRKQCRPPPFRPALSTYWNPTRDTLYLPDFHVPEGIAVDVAWDAVDNSDACLPNDDSLIGGKFHHHNLMAMQHLALPWNTKVANGFDARSDPESSTGHQCGGEWMPRWLLGFPSLRSVTFLLEPSSLCYRPGGIELYEPKDARELHEYDRDMPVWFADSVPFTLDDLAVLIEWKLKVFTQNQIPNIQIKVPRHGKTRKTVPFCVTRSRSRRS